MLRKKNVLVIMSLLGLLTFSACDNAEPENTPEINSEIDKGLIADPESISKIESELFTLDKAKELFLQYHPNASIEIAKQEGEVYYIQGIGDDNIYKMKFKISDEEILLNKEINANDKLIKNDGEELLLEDEIVPTETPENAVEKDIPEESPIDEPESEAPSEPVEEENGTVSLESAKSTFSNNYPNVPIEVAKQEGDTYYIQGRSGNTIYKMKIRISDGEIILNKAIQTGRRY